MIQGVGYGQMARGCQGPGREVLKRMGWQGEGWPGSEHVASHLGQLSSTGLEEKVPGHSGQKHPDLISREVCGVI